MNEFNALQLCVLQYSFVLLYLLIPAIFTVQTRITQYYRRMRRGNAFGRVRLSLSVGVCLLLRQTSKSLESNFWYTSTSSEHQGQASNIEVVSRSRSHELTKCTHLRVICIFYHNWSIIIVAVTGSRLTDRYKLTSMTCMIYFWRYRNSISGLVFGDVAHWGRLKSTREPNFGEISESTADILLLPFSNDHGRGELRNLANGNRRNSQNLPGENVGPGYWILCCVYVCCELNNNDWLFLHCRDAVILLSDTISAIFNLYRGDYRSFREG